ncbi:hypothetical protein VTO42DRAFT_4156 [Malbranchea cinnamomea]
MSDSGPPSPASDYPKLEHHRYDAQHILQDVYVYLPRPLHVPPLQHQPAPGYWVIYIHGGAWRDPEILAPSFSATQELLSSSSSSSTVSNAVIGYASINYRLTAHPRFPQDPTTVDRSEYRNAKHPEHLLDVRRALAFLQSRYAIGNRYLLVGHSCGATLAFQTVVDGLLDQPDQAAGTLAVPVPQPLAIVGVSGIYHLRLLRDTFSSCAVYQEFIEAAFGKDEDEWDRASPGHGRGVVDGWKTGRLALIAHSGSDELVDISQLQTMQKVLDAWKTQAWKGAGRRVLVVDDLQDAHDDIWRKGAELARVIQTAIEELIRMEEAAPL